MTYGPSAVCTTYLADSKPLVAFRKLLVDAWFVKNVSISIDDDTSFSYEDFYGLHDWNGIVSPVTGTLSRLEYWYSREPSHNNNNSVFSINEESKLRALVDQSIFDLVYLCDGCERDRGGGLHKSSGSQYYYGNEFALFVEIHIKINAISAAERAKWMSSFEEGRFSKELAKAEKVAVLREDRKSYYNCRKDGYKWLKI